MRTVSRVITTAVAIAMAVVVLIYVFWPANRQRFDRAKRSVLDDENGPEPRREGESWQ